MLGDGCTCDLGWVMLTLLLDRDARHPSLQGTCAGYSPQGCWSPDQIPVSRNVTSDSSIGFPLPETFPRSSHISDTYSPHAYPPPWTCMCLVSVPVEPSDLEHGLDQRPRQGKPFSGLGL